MVTATPRGITVQTLDGTTVEPRIIVVDWEAEQAQKGGYPHFLLKEIHEQPEALRNVLRGRIDDLGMVALTELGVADAVLTGVDEVVIVACGSAWYAAQVARHAIEHLAHMRCSVETASEFRYWDTLVGPRSLVIAFSQSGETADTLAAVRHAKKAGAPVIAVTNVLGSALSMEAGGVLYMQAGPEISVAATKTFVDQMACGLLLALHLGDVRGTLDVAEHQRFAAAFQGVPALIEQALELAEEIGVGTGVCPIGLRPVAEFSIESCRIGSAAGA